MPEVASRVVADLGASDLALDAFSSGTSAHLRVCEKYWSAQDSAWRKHWGPHQGLMWIHCPRWDIPRAVAKIRKDRSKAVLVVPMGCTEEESTRHWVVSLTNMTLNKVVLPAGESVYHDAKGQPMPPQRWPTEFHYVLKPVRTPVAILGSLGVCIYVPASRHWLISYSPVHLN